MFLPSEGVLVHGTQCGGSSCTASLTRALLLAGAKARENQRFSIIVYYMLSASAAASIDN